VWSNAAARHLAVIDDIDAGYRLAPDDIDDRLARDASEFFLVIGFALVLAH
jgi:hypothetical protein